MLAYFPSDNSLPPGCNDMSATVRRLLNKFFSFLLPHGKDSYCCLGEEEILQIRASLQENVIFSSLICFYGNLQDWNLKGKDPDDYVVRRRHGVIQNVYHFHAQDH